eukprot:SAG11_NODE_17387_length_520_cov_0.959620_1_plen_135_part_00
MQVRCHSQPLLLTVMASGRRSCFLTLACRSHHVLPYSPEPGEKQDTDTSDAEDMLGAKAHQYLMPADKYAFIAAGDTEVDTTGNQYRKRFQAGDIDWFKRVIRSFRTSLGYTKDDTDQVACRMPPVLGMGTSPI